MAFKLFNPCQPCCKITPDLCCAYPIPNYLCLNLTCNIFRFPIDENPHKICPCLGGYEYLDPIQYGHNITLVKTGINSWTGTGATTICENTISAEWQSCILPNQFGPFYQTGRVFISVDGQLMASGLTTLGCPDVSGHFFSADGEITTVRSVFTGNEFCICESGTTCSVSITSLAESSGCAHRPTGECCDSFGYDNITFSGSLLASFVAPNCCFQGDFILVSGQNYFCPISETEPCPSFMPAKDLSMGIDGSKCDDHMFVPSEIQCHFTEEHQLPIPPFLPGESGSSDCYSYFFTLSGMLESCCPYQYRLYGEVFATYSQGGSEGNDNCYPPCIFDQPVELLFTEL